MSGKSSESSKFRLNFAKLKPNMSLKSSITLPNLPPVSILKFSENQSIKTRVFSDLAAFKLNSERPTYLSPSRKTKDSLQQDQLSLFSALGVISHPQARQLPKDLSKLRDIIGTSRNPERQALGNPATREDTVLLADWLDCMLKTALSEKNNNLESLCETAMLIYEVSFSEIVRQVSVQCVERGNLISRIWKAYLGILEKALSISKTLQAYQLSVFEEERKSIHKEYFSEISELKNENKAAKENIARMSRQLKNRDDEISHLAQKEVRLIEKMQILQREYEQSKQDLLYSQESNRIMKAKLASSSVEFVESNNGVIEPRLVNILKVKKKREEDIQKIIQADPLLSAQLISDEKSENLVKSIEKYEEFTKEYLNHQDFLDKACETENETKTQEVQTETVEVSIKRQGSLPSTVQLMELKIENVLDIEESASEMRDQESISEAEMKLNTEEYLLKFQEKIDQVNALLERIKTNVQAKIPASYQRELLSNLFFSVSESISTMKTDFEKETAQESFLRNSGKARMLTFIQKNKKIKKPTMDLITAVTQKIINTPTQRLKSIIIKKILLKMIKIFYEAKMKKTQEGDRKQDLSQIVIEIYYNKYGMPKVVEMKFSQLLASCIKYKSIKRVHLFGRFLKLFKGSSMDDFNFYIDSLASMKQTYYIENFEELRMPYDKALDWYKYFLPSVFSEPDRIKMKLFLESYKQIDPITRVATIDVDSVLEYGIEIIQKHRAENLDFLKSIYEAGDVIFRQLNQDGFLEYHEFELINRHIYPIMFNSKFCKEMFQEFAETFTGENEETVQALSFENFSHLNTKFAVFTPERLGAFIKLRGESTYSGKEMLYIEEVKESSKNIEYTLSEMRWRYFQARNLENREEMLSILDLVQQQIRQLKKPQAVLIALRLMDQESKRACVLVAMSQLLPNFVSGFNENQNF